MKTIHPLLCIAFITILGCSQLSDYPIDSKKYSSGMDDSKISCSPANDLLDAKKNPTGYQTGTAASGELHPIVDGFEIIPLTGLGDWTMFTPHLDTAMLMGDIVIREKDFTMVEKEVTATGLAITDIHKHPARDRSVILFMHIKGFGNETTLSGSVDALFKKLKGAGWNSAGNKTNTDTKNLNTAQLDSIIGYKGGREGKVYKYDLARLNLLKAQGLGGKSASEYNTWAAWQGTDQAASVAGDFMMLENEVEPVMKALAENGFELVHNQLVHERPKIFCLHYWGNGNAEKLAKGLRDALTHQEKDQY